MNNFLHWCLNMAWLPKFFSDLPLVVLCIFFYRHKVSITLQRTQHLHFEMLFFHEKTSFKLPYFHIFHPFSFLIGFLWLVGVNQGGTWFVHLPLFVHLWSSFFWAQIWVPFFLFLLLFCWVFYLMEFVRFHHR
jgi:hypothetical protein